MTHYFANVLYLSICMLGNCSCFYFRLLTFFKIKFLKINRPWIPSECQTVWIQIKTDILLVFIWVQTVCKRLLADDKINHCKLILNMSNHWIPTTHIAFSVTNESSGDQDQTLQNVAADQGSHYLLTERSIKNGTKMKNTSTELNWSNW